MDREPPSFKIGNRIYFKNKQLGEWDLRWRPGYRIVCTECNIHYLHIENQARGKERSCNVKDIVLKPPMEFWNIDTQFSRAKESINHATNLPTITMNHWRWTPYSCKQSPVNNLYSSSLQHIELGYTHWCNSPPGLFQPVLKAYPTCHSWIITAHISLGNLEKQWRMFIKQLRRKQ